MLVLPKLDLPRLNNLTTSSGLLGVVFIRVSSYTQQRSDPDIHLFSIDGQLIKHCFQPIELHSDYLEDRSNETIRNTSTINLDIKAVLI